MTHKTLSFYDLHLSPHEVYVQMGYGDILPDSRVASEVAEIMEKTGKVARPRFCYHVTSGRLQIHPCLLYLDNITMQVGRIISRQLSGSESIALFVATAGKEYDQWRKQEKDPVRTFICDAVGSVMVERCADLMENALQDSIDKLGWHHTNRFSPGYCGWDVADQQLLFPLLGESPCGVTLTEGQMMVPVKSVSGIIGLGPTVKKHPYPCAFCNNLKCFKRKGGTEKSGFHS